jgi:hypothetical protein
MLTHVSVWLDELAPEQGAFAHALQWASSLGLPLRGALWSGKGPAAKGGNQLLISQERLEEQGHVLKACATACARKGVPWEGFQWEAAPALCAGEFFKPNQLCVFGHFLDELVRQALLYGSLRSLQTAILICPKTWAPWSRVVVVDQGHHPASTYLVSAARLCRALRAEPVVLSVARSEKEARLRQQLAETLFAAETVPATFDFVVGYEVQVAVALAVRCRRCSHVVIERQSAPAWRRWFRGDLIRQLLRLSNSLTLLSLAGTGGPLLSEDQRGSGERSRSSPTSAILN